MRNDLKIITKRSNWSVIWLIIVLNFLLIYLSSLVFLSEWMQNIQSSTHGLVDPNLIVFSVMSLLLIVFVLWYKSKFSIKQLGLVNFKQGLISIVLIWLGSQLITFLINLSFNHEIALNDIWSNWGLGYIIGFLAAMIIGTALFEEVIFRGYIFPQFYLAINSRYRLLFAISISSFLFSIWHIPSLVNIVNLANHEIFIRLIMLFLVGIIFCLAYLRTGNVYVLIAIHALNNAPTPLMSSPLNASSIVQITSVLLLIFWPFLFGKKKMKEWYHIGL